MYAKLAWRNIRRSLRDYAIYFLTLVFAVAIFYVFNSLGDQPALEALRTSTRRMAQGAVKTMEWLTFILTGVVALLVLYANRVIIKKRNRELGTYLLLGMEQGHLSFLLLLEITVIGLVALLVGLVSGIFLSQFFALVVAKVFGAGLTGHPFVFSAGAAVRTLLAYGITFVAVGLWQAAVVYRQRLIELIYGGRKNEELRVRSRTLSVVAGSLSALALGAAYWLADQVSRDATVSPTDSRIWTGAALAVAGTYLLFTALAGLLNGVRRRVQRGWLARGLNLFLYRQVTSKINTHAAMLATIALMLTFTICAMSFGLGLGRAVAARAERDMPFDYLFLSTSPTETFEQVVSLMDQYGVTERRSAQFKTTPTELRGTDLMLPDDATWFLGQTGVGEMLGYVHVEMMPFSAYQELRSLKGYTAATLPEGGYLLHFKDERSEHFARARQAFERFMTAGKSLELGGRILRPATAQVLTEPLGSELINFAALLVVPDDVAAAVPTGQSYLVMQVEGEVPEALDDALQAIYEQRSVSGGHLFRAIIRAEEIGTAFIMEGMLLFLASYIGVMFILISATLLALQQVTDAVEHRQRFEVLRKLGADEPMIDRTIARQLGLYFLTPVMVALLHSLVAMTALNRLFWTAAGFTTVWSATLVTLGIFGAIYATYYLLSLQSCRALFREPQPE